MPTPEEVERAREWMETQRNTGIFSSQHEDVYDLLAAYHAHASAMEQRQYAITHTPLSDTTREYMKKQSVNT